MTEHINRIKLTIMKIVCDTQPVSCVARLKQAIFSSKAVSLNFVGYAMKDSYSKASVDKVMISFSTFLFKDIASRCAAIV